MKLKILKQALCVTLILGACSATFAKDKDDDKDHKKKGHSKKGSDDSPKPKSSGGPPGKPSGGPAGKPSGGAMHKPSDGPSRNAPQASQPSRPAPNAPSRGGPPSVRHVDHHDGPVVRHDGPRIVEPARRPAVVLGVRPPFGLFRRSGPPVVSVTQGVSGADVQQALAERGYYRGSIDGEIGPMSRGAIAAFQADAGLPATGEINSSLLRALGL